MLILLTNDDGIFAPGLAAMEKELRRLGNVVIAAPATEQSGVGHSITFRTPLLYRQVPLCDGYWGWAVEGTPADCVKIGISYICGKRPDLVVSGMNIGLNAGINVLYSGTVAAAVEASLYRINSFAVSMEYCEDEKLTENINLAAKKAVQIIETVLETKKEQTENTNELYNLNIPLRALHGDPQVKVVPMDMNQYWDNYEQRLSPSGRPYFWLIGRPVPRNDKSPQNTDEPTTDLQAIGQGHITITPLDFDMTKYSTLQQLTNMEAHKPQALARGRIGHV